MTRNTVFTRIAKPAGLRCGFLAMAIAVSALAGSTHLFADTSPQAISVPAQSLSEAIVALSRQTNTVIMANADLISGETSKAVNGTMTLEDALGQMLSGSGFQFVRNEDGTYGVTKAAVDQEAREVQQQSQKAKVINEIVVTATKRETSLQDTAMSITAIGNEEIARRGLIDMEDYLSAVPGVSFMNQSAVQKHIVVRGLTSNPQIDGAWGPLVGVYFGEVPLQGQMGGITGTNPDIKLVDIERVEVLRGPQGTLYGSSSMGGTIRNVPASPNLSEFEGDIKAGYSDTVGFGSGNSELQGIVNMPIIKDKLALRAVAYRFDNSGFYKNIGASDPNVAQSVATYGAVATSDDEIGENETTGVRVSLLWRPTEKLDIRLSYLNQEVIQDGWPSADVDLGTDGYLQGRLGRLNAPNFISDTSFDNEGFSIEHEFANVTIEYDMGWASLLSSTSWVDGESINYQEYGELAFSGVPVGLSAKPRSDSFFEEIRLTSQLEGPLQFILGLYYEDIDGREQFQYSYSGTNPTNNPFGETTLLYGITDVTTEQKALFGEVSYKLSNQLKLSGGIRYFDYDSQLGSSLIDGLFAPPGGSNSILTTKQSDVSYKAAIDYTPNENALLYASWSQGFRLGRATGEKLPALCDLNSDGIVDGSNGITLDPGQLDSDTVDSYELGGKFTLLSNRLNMNVALFQSDWEKIPVNVIFNVTCNVQLNAGEARSRGIEIEGIYNLDDNLLLNIGGSYVTAELTQDSGTFGNDGDRLPGAPEYNFNLGLQYDFSILGYETYIRSDYYYVGGFYNNLQETGLEIADYGMWNARAGTQLGDIRVEVFATNITNEDARTWVETFDPNRVNRLQPRTIGMNIGYRF